MKVLVADDDPVTRRALVGLLETLGHGAVEARDGVEAWQVIQECDGPALLILDWMMPKLSGLQICQGIRRNGKKPYPYILMVTARSATSDVVEALEAGADDYLKKPFDIRELRARVRAAERLIIVQNELLARSITDELTGALNRRGIFDRINRELSLLARYAPAPSVILVDADNFKQINDTHGHAVGDEILIGLTHRMKEQLRSYDDVGRHGGEEFAILLPACSVQNGVAVAERIRRAIASSPLETSAGPVSLTVSLGVTSAEACDPQGQAENIIAAADRALYTAKHAGKNRVEAAYPSLASPA